MTIDEELKLINAKLDVLLSLCSNMIHRTTLTEKILAANNCDTLFDKTDFDRIKQETSEYLRRQAALVGGRVTFEMVG